LTGSLGAAGSHRDNERIALDYFFVLLT